jgi:serine/threonine protein kinase
MYRSITNRIGKRQKQQQQQRDERIIQTNHSNYDISYALPTIRDIFTNDDNDDVWYIVQDYVVGGNNLGMYILPTSRSNTNGMTIQQQLTESQIRSLIKSILLALCELHEINICHNDIRPGNILVQRHQQYKQQQHNQHDDRRWKDLKLCDLGRAKFINNTGDSDNNNNNPRHSSLYYTSPEVILGHPSCLASDMWSVGVILYQCFSSGGELPFCGYNNRGNNKVSEGNNNSRSRSHSKSNSSASSLSAYCPSLSLSLSSSSSSSIYSNTSSSSTTLLPATSTTTNNKSNKKISTTKLRQQIKQQICQGDYNFGNSRSWSNVSREAKQFISNLLHTDPTVRMTCKDALSHPWIINSNDHVITTISGGGGGGIISGVSPHHYHHHPLYYSSSSSPLLRPVPVPVGRGGAAVGATGAAVTSMERQEQQQQQQQKRIYLHQQQHQHQYYAATAGTGTGTAASSTDAGTTKSNNSDDSNNIKSMVHTFFGRFKKNNNNNKYHQNHQRHQNQQHQRMQHRSTKSDTSAAVATHYKYNSAAAAIIISSTKTKTPKL